MGLGPHFDRFWATRRSVVKPASMAAVNGRAMEPCEKRHACVPKGVEKRLKESNTLLFLGLNSLKELIARIAA